MIHLRCVVGPDGLRRNRDHAAGLGLPWLAAEPDKGRSLAIVGGGPSSGEYLDEILVFPGDVMAVNGAYRWLKEAGRTADYVVALDPQPNMVPFFDGADERTRFYVATMCDPAVFDALAGLEVVLWHAPQSDDDKGRAAVPGGPTALCRGVVIALITGFRDVTVYGADSCYTGAASHAYGGTDPDPKWVVRCGGVDWLTKPGLLSQAEHLTETIRRLPFPIRLRGSHLASALLEHETWERVA